MVYRVFIHLSCAALISCSLGISQAGEALDSDPYYLHIAKCSAASCRVGIAEKLSRLDHLGPAPGSTLLDCGDTVFMGPYPSRANAERRKRKFQRFGVMAQVVQPIIDPELLVDVADSERAVAEPTVNQHPLCTVAFENIEFPVDKPQKQPEPQDVAPNESDLKLAVALSRRSALEKESFTAELQQNRGFAFDSHKQRLDPHWKSFSTDTKPSEMFWTVNFEAPLVDDILETTAEVRYGNFQNSKGLGITKRDKYLLKLGVSGNHEPFGYGFSFSSVGRNYIGALPSDLKKDVAGYEAWLSWQYKDFNLKTRYSELWTNVDRDPGRSRTYDRWWKFGSRYAISADPAIRFSLTYGIGERNRPTTEIHSDPYRGPLASLDANFQYSHNFLNVTFGSNLFRAKNEQITHDMFTRRKFYVSGTLFPESVISVYPKYSLNRYIYDKPTWSDVFNKANSSLAVVYQPPKKPFRLSLQTVFDQYFNASGLADKETMNIGSKLEWRDRKTKSGQNIWALELRHKDFDNGTYPGSSFSDWSIELTWSWSNG